MISVLKIEESSYEKMTFSFIAMKSIFHENIPFIGKYNHYMSYRPRLVYIFHLP